MINSVLELAAKFRRALLLQDEAMIKRLIEAYLQLYGRLVDKIDLLMFDIGAMVEPTKAAVSRLARYGDLLESIADELTRYSAYAQVEISTSAKAAIDLAIKDTTSYLKFYGLHRPAMLPTAAIETMLGFLSPEGELYKRLGQLAGENAAKVADAILEGIGFGYNPKKVARMIQQYLGGGLTDAMRMARTTHLYAYREATRANYLANADVVQGWIWWAELDGSVCMSCVAQHGSIHPLSEKLDDHHNGRCAMLPYLGDNPVEQSGEAWFNEQSEELQRKMMGGDKFDAWKDGKFDFGQLSSTYSNDVFGEMRGETGLKDLLGNKEPESIYGLSQYEDILANQGDLRETCKYYDNYMDGLTKEQRKAIINYTNGGYEDINGALRDLRPYDLSGNTLKNINSIDNAFDNAPVIDRDMIVFRGSTTRLPLSIGDEFVDYGYVSTTVRKGTRRGGDLIEIIIPKGSTGTMYLESLSAYKGSEYEMLIKRGSRFRCLRAEDWIVSAKKYVLLYLGE